MMIVFGGVSEFGRELIAERMDTGRAAAKARGVRFGRPSKFNTEQRALAARLLEEGKSVGEVARTFDVHPATVYRLAQTPVTPNACRSPDRKRGSFTLLCPR